MWWLQRYLQLIFVNPGLITWVGDSPYFTTKLTKSTSGTHDFLVMTQHFFSTRNSADTCVMSIFLKHLSYLCCLLTLSIHWKARFCSYVFSYGFTIYLAMNLLIGSWNVQQQRSRTTQQLGQGQVNKLFFMSRHYFVP